VLCFRKGLEAEPKKFVKEACTTLHTTPAGKQVLMLFQRDKVVPFKTSYLDGVKKLLAEHRKLTEKDKKKPKDAEPDQPRDPGAKEAK
jgi:hypothetical protein